MAAAVLLCTLPFAAADDPEDIAQSEYLFDTFYDAYSDFDDFDTDTDFVSADFDPYGVDLYAATTENTYYYSNGFIYNDSGHTSLVADKSLSDIINDATKETLIYIQSTHYIKNDSEDWHPAASVTLKQGGSGVQMVHLVDTGSLTLSGNLTIEGTQNTVILFEGAPRDANDKVIGDAASGTLTINDGVTIIGCKGTLESGHGGIIYMTGGGTGTIEMYGGFLQDGSIGGNGGGVYVGGGTFNMYGGTITKCSAGKGGGGVYVASGSKFNMYGGTIADNTGSSNAENAGVLNGGTMTMTGGSVQSVSGNKPRKDGATLNKVEVDIGTVGGVLVTSADVDIYDAGGNPVPNYYNFYDTYTDESGKIYLWLPAGYKAVYRYADKTEYDAYDYKADIQKYDEKATPKQYADIEADATTNRKEVPIQTKLRATLKLLDQTGQTTEDDETAVAAFSLDEGIAVVADDDTTTLTTDKTQITNYTWQRSTGMSSNDPGTSDADWNDISGASGKTESLYTPDVYDAGHWVRVVITTDNADHPTYASDPVWITVPQISIAVPTTLIVTVSPTGTTETAASGTTKFTQTTVGDETTVQTDSYNGSPVSGTANGAIQNHSAVDVYLTEVTFTWRSETSGTDNSPLPKEIFTNWNATDGKPTITLKIADNSDELEKTIDADTGTVTWTIDREPITVSGGTLALNWTFDLNNNSISQALNAGEYATLGTITYTVSILPEEGEKT